MIIYFIIVAIGIFFAGRLILGELQKEKTNYVPISPVEVNTKAQENVQEVERVIEQKVEDTLTNLEQSLPSQLTKLDSMLKEKNVQLKKLQALLEMEQKHKVEIEKIKSLLEWQVFESRQMNRDVKRELLEINTKMKTLQEEALRLKTDLNYKNQQLHQNEVVVSELKNRLLGYGVSEFTPQTPASEKINKAFSDEKFS